MDTLDRTKHSFVFNYILRYFALPAVSLIIEIDAHRSSNGEIQ